MKNRIVELLVLMASISGFAAGDNENVSLRLTGAINSSFNNADGGINEFSFSPSGNLLLLTHRKLEKMKIVIIDKDNVDVREIPYRHGQWDQHGNLHVDFQNGTKVLKDFVDKAKGDPNDLKKTEVYFTDQAGNSFKLGRIPKWSNIDILNGTAGAGSVPFDSVTVHDNGVGTKLDLDTPLHLQGVQYDQKKKRVAFNCGNEYIFYNLLDKKKTVLTAYIHETRTEFTYYLVEGQDILILLERQSDKEGGRYIKESLKVCDLSGEVLFGQVLAGDNQNYDSVDHISVSENHVAVTLSSNSNGNQQLRIYAIERRRTIWGQEENDRGSGAF